MTVLWLDDYRDPYEWIEAIPVESNAITNIIWVKSHVEFIDWIKANGLPDIVCFDHDLSQEHYHHIPQSAAEHEVIIDSFEEKTGYHSAKWLIDYCMNKGVKLPMYSSHSANPVGRVRILSLLSSYRNHIETKKP